MSEGRDVVMELFAQRVSNPAAWFRNARALFSSARAASERCLHPIDPLDRMDTNRVVSMLYGFGLECLFKALIVLDDFGDPHSPDWAPQAVFPKKLATHDLEKLASMIDPELGAQQQWALRYFTDAAVWMGRYPCSKDGAEGSIFIDPNLFAVAEEIYAKYAIRFSISG